MGILQLLFGKPAPRAPKNPPYEGPIISPDSPAYIRPQNRLLKPVAESAQALVEAGAVNRRRDVYNIVRARAEEWSPDTQPDEILALQMPMDRVTIGSDPEAAKVVASTKWDAQQVARAVAQLSYWQLDESDKKRTVLVHKHSGRKVAVSMKQYASEHQPQALVFEMDEDGHWRVHKIQHAYWTEAETGRFYICGDVEHISSLCLKHGGKYAYRDGKGCYMWQSPIPSEIMAYAERTHLTKYHHLVTLLRGGRIAIDPGNYPIAQIEFTLGDAYQREHWRIAGFEYEAFPGYRVR